MNTVRTFAFLALLLVPSPARSQGDTSELSAYFQNVRASLRVAVPSSILSEPDDRATLARLTPFLDDSSTNVRIKACEMVYRVASASSDSRIQETAVGLLVDACARGHAAVNGVALNYLKGFPRSAFSENAIERMEKLLSSDYTHPAELIRLIGFLRLTGLVPRLKEFATSGNNAAIRWASLISRARMGDEAAVHEMMTRVRRLPVNDHVVYDVFPDLVFSRSPEAISYLVSVLHRDTNDCLSADAEREVMIPCGYRIMEQLAPIIQDFPLERDSSGDLETADYPAALAQVRQWFRDHTQYVIIDETY